jgi:hypothetical protein
MRKFFLSLTPRSLSARRRAARVSQLPHNSQTTFAT